MPEIRRLLARLFTRPCRSCSAPVGRYADLCDSCIGRLPVVEMWDFRAAREWRLAHPGAYRDALATAGAWLTANPKRDTETTTTRERQP